ncbi:MAG: hypothetical protein IPP71_09980 [Bacteroidetes bacterium]|nr:hypothetical protein [Bacteroidota bacterium]
MIKEDTITPIGELAGRDNFAENYKTITGYVVNEVIVWTYQDTLDFDNANDTNYAESWCHEAIQQGYIYIVDFAGFGVPND